MHPLRIALACLCLLPARAADVFPEEWKPWVESRVAELETRFARETATRADWERDRERMRRELKGMLGLDPEPPRGDLRPVVTGQLEREGVVVEKLHFQSLPGLYVTANFYRPKATTGRLPTILYLCGHGRETGADGRSNGNKTHYQHHGAWFASHGYNCLILDTVQWGEILGQHWGTYKLERWWWISRGYTPAGVEAWSGMRALDYLTTRPEVDMAKVGVTGRSGGGAYSWFIAALDERVSVAAPTAGITTLRDHTVEGCIGGHCDCMYMLNTQRWDFDRVAALVAPRPLLLSNTDKDTIFPLDGVHRIFTSTRRLYRLLDAEKNLGLQYAEGPHHDSQPLHIGAFHWFERFLKGAPVLAQIAEPARPLFKTDELRVFAEIPSDEINTRIDETFVPLHAPIPVPVDRADWERQKATWMTALRERVLRWEDRPWTPLPSSDPPLHGRRALALLGDTLDSLRTRELVERHRDTPATTPLQARGEEAGRLLHASLFLPGGRALNLEALSTSHQNGPYYPGILRHFDLNQALALAAEKHRITLAGNPADWQWALDTATRLGFAGNLVLQPPGNAP